MNVHSPENGSRERKTIGLLATSIDDNNGRRLWTGINEACQKNDLNLISFTGSELDSPGGFSRQSNMIYDMVDQGRLSGLVIWASSLSTYIGLEAIQRFCEAYHPLPLVAVGLALDGIPSIILDSYEGMRAVVLHLAREHGYRRVAYFRGPERHPEAQIRYQAYLDVVQECGLSGDPALVTPPGSWMEPWGREAARQLVEERQVKFDAIVSVNDRLAIGAMEYLQERKINIPGGLAITGFDNSMEGHLVTPPLTSVSNRMKERGRQSVKMLISQFAGQPVPELVTLPGLLRIRSSCGCPDPLIVEAGLPEPGVEQPAPGDEPIGLSEQAATRREAIRVALEQSIELDDLPPEWASEILDSFLRKRAIEDPADNFLVTLRRLLNQTSQAGSELIAWQKVINVLRARALPLLRSDPDQANQAERFLHQARVMVGESSVRAQGFLDWKQGQQLNELMRLRQGVSGARDLKELVDILSSELCHLEIQRCYLALYVEPEHPVTGARLALAYDETGRHTGLEGRIFSPSWQLTRLLHNRPLPFSLDDPQNLVVYPLYFRDEQLGYMLLDARNYHKTTHQVLCEQVSSALKSVMLVEENSRLYQKALEAQREAEEADLLKSRFLSMVSHELLTPIVLLMGLSEMMLREGIFNRPPLPEAYHRDLTRIQAGAQQLGSLVRDVLDLARGQLGQLKLAEKPVSMEEVFKPVLLVGEQMAQSKGLGWRVEVPPDLPMVMGDTARLQQVTLNLVNNAIKFTAQGEVVLVAEAKDGFITVSVRDTGLGVPPEEQEAIFDEFRQSDRTVSRGYGGLGIGLAICRQIIELHGGKIGVRCSGEENSGSTFYYVLPGIPFSPVANPVAHSQIVLILTGWSEQAAPLRKHLSGEGFQVEVIGVEETPEWLPAVQALAPGAVILDMPVAVQGMELMKKLKSNTATHDVPVIFYSLLQEQINGSMLILDYMVKPFTGLQLDAALGRFGFTECAREKACTILVVDDNPDILDLHARLVANHIKGCRVLRAANGLEALDLMRRTIPSLVLLDLMMPELDGAGVLGAMHEDDQLRDIPVIVVTAQSLTEEQMAHLNQGVVSVLSKGVFTAQETLVHIDRALSQTRRVGNDTQRLVRKVMAYIHEHYAESITRDQLSSYAMVSDRHLNRCFMQETGLTPGVYLNRYRIQQAKHLLRERRCSITEVMKAVGFSDSSYFTHVFRREVGVSPSEYQRGKN